MSSRAHEAISTAEELVTRGDLRGALDVMINAGPPDPPARPAWPSADGTASRAHTPAIADLDPAALARVAAGMGLTAMMRAARGENASIATAQALLLIELASRELLERILGGSDRVDRLVGALEQLRRVKTE